MEPSGLQALFASTTIVLDGGFATQLEAQGADLADPLWSARLLLEDPGQIVRAHLAFFRAGARVATTASYQATFEGFARRGLDRAAAAALLRRSVELAAAAREQYRDECAPFDPDPLLVAASVGPYGAFLADGSEYRGNYGLSVDALADFHRERLAILAASDADILACETIPEIPEAEALVRLLDETPGSAAWLSFSCADGERIRSGARIEEAVEVAGSSRTGAVVAVGINCTAPEHAESLVARAAAVTSLPLVVYPNSGEGWDAAAKRWLPGSGALTDGAAAARWVRAGAGLVGGCCRVTPAQIAEIAAAVG